MGVCVCVCSVRVCACARVCMRTRARARVCVCVSALVCESVSACVTCRGATMQRAGASAMDQEGFSWRLAEGMISRLYTINCPGHEKHIACWPGTSKTTQGPVLYRLR